MLAALAGHHRLAAAGVLAVAAMGPSRVLVDVHCASDVAAGYAFGPAWLIGSLLPGLPWAGGGAGGRRSG